jgi:hypothetical protein
MPYSTATIAPTGIIAGEANTEVGSRSSSSGRPLELWARPLPAAMRGADAAGDGNEKPWAHAGSGHFTAPPLNPGGKPNLRPQLGQVVKIDIQHLVANAKETKTGG